MRIEEKLVIDGGEVVYPDSSSDSIDHDILIAEEASKDDSETSIDEVLNKASGQRTQCYVALNEMRGNGLCLRTSGAASQFYNAATKTYFVKRDVCENIIPKCATTFVASMQVVKYASVLNNLSYCLNRSAKRSKNKDKIAQFTRIIDQSVSSDVLGLWEQCAKDTEACVKDEEMLATLCGEVTVSQDNKAVEGDKDAVEDAEKTSEEVEEGIINEEVTDVVTNDNEAVSEGRRLNLQTGSLATAASTSTIGDNGGKIQIDASGADLGSETSIFASGDAEDKDPSQAGGKAEGTTTSAAHLVSVLTIFFSLMFNQF